MKNLATAHLYKKHQVAASQQPQHINRDITDIGLPFDQSPHPNSRNQSKSGQKSGVYYSDQADGRRSGARRHQQYAGKSMTGKMPKIVEKQSASNDQELDGQEAQGSSRTITEQKKQNSFLPSRNSRVGRESGHGGNQMHQVFQNIESIQEQLINDRFEGNLLNDQVKSVRNSQLSLDYQQPKQHTSSQYKTLDAHISMSGSKQQLFVGKLPSHLKQVVNLPALPNYDKRSKSIQNSQYIDALKFGNEFGQMSHDNSRMLATYINHQRNRTIDYDKHHGKKGSMYAASDHHNRIRALKDIDRDIRQALNNAKLESTAQSLIQSTTERFSKVNFQFDEGIMQRERSKIEKYDMLNPQNKLSNQTFQQKILGNASKVNFDLKPHIKEMNKVKMESWKMPTENAKCQSILRIMNKFKTELYADMPNNQFGQTRNGMNHSQLVYRLNQSSEKELDSVQEDNNWMVMSSTTMQQQMTDTGFHSIREKLEQYMSPSHLKKKIAFKEKQLRSRTHRVSAAQSSHVNFPSISVKVPKEADCADSNRATIGQFTQLLTRQRPTLITSRLMKNYREDKDVPSDAEETDNGKNKPSKLQQQRIASHTFTQKEFKERNMTLNDRKFEKFKQILFKQENQPYEKDKAKGKNNSMKTRNISHSVMTKFHDKSSTYLLENQKPQGPHQQINIQSPKSSDKRDQNLSPREGDEESNTSRQSPTVSKGNESREHMQQLVTPNIIQLNEHIQRTKQMQMRASDDEERDVTLKTPLRNKSQRKSSIEVAAARGKIAQEDRGTGIGKDGHEGAQNQLNQTLPLLRQNKQRSKNKNQTTIQPSSNNKGLDFLQKVQNEAEKFTKLRRHTEQPTNEGTTPTANNKTDQTRNDNQRENQLSPNRSSLYDSVNVTNYDFFKNSKMSPKLFHLNQTNQNQTFTPYKLDNQVELELVKQQAKAQQLSRLKQKAKKINLEVKGKQKQLGSMQDWLINQQKQMLREQQGKDDRIKIIQQNLGDEDEPLGFKNIDNAQPEQRSQQNKDTHLASKNHLFSEGTQIQSPTSLRNGAFDGQNIYAGVNGSQQQQSPLLYAKHEGKNLIDVWERGSNHLQTLQDIQSANGTGMNSAANIQNSLEHGHSTNQRVHPINQTDKNQSSSPNLNFQNYSPKSPLLKKKHSDKMDEHDTRGGSQMLHISPQPLSLPNQDSGLGVSGDNLPQKSKKFRNKHRQQLIQQQIQDRSKMSKINLVFDGKEVPNRRRQPAQVPAVRDGMSPALQNQVQRLININSSLQSTESKGQSQSPYPEGSGSGEIETAKAPMSIKQVLNLPTAMQISSTNAVPTAIDHSISIKDAQYPSEIQSELSPTMANASGLPIPSANLLKPGQIKEMELSSEGEDGGDGEPAALRSKHHIIQIIDSDKNLQNLSHLKSIQQLQQLASMHSLHTEDERRRQQEEIGGFQAVINEQYKVKSKQKLSVVNLDLNVAGVAPERVHTVMGISPVKTVTKLKQRVSEKRPNEGTAHIAKISKEVDMFSPQKFDIQFQVQSKTKLRGDPQCSSPVSKRSTKAAPSNKSLKQQQVQQHAGSRPYTNKISTGGDIIESYSRPNEQNQPPISPASGLQEVKVKEVKIIKSHIKNKEHEKLGETQRAEDSAGAEQEDQPTQQEEQPLYLQTNELRQSSGAMNPKESITMSPLKTPKDNKSLKSSQIFSQTMKMDQQAAAKIERQLSSIENTSQKQQKTDRHDINQWQIQSVQSAAVGGEHQVPILEDGGKASPRMQGDLREQANSSSMTMHPEAPGMAMKTEKFEHIAETPTPSQPIKERRQGHDALEKSPKVKKKGSGMQMLQADSKRSIAANKGKKQVDKKKASSINVKKGDKNMFNNQMLREMQTDEAASQADKTQKGAKQKSPAAKAGSGGKQSPSNKKGN